MDIFVARQPIFNRRQRVIAYELLFRTGLENAYNFDDADFATMSVVSDSFLVLGLDKLTDGKRAFINFTGALLKKGIPFFFHRDIIAIEITEDIRPDDEIIQMCQRLTKQGYMLVLDDFSMQEWLMPFAELADIIKVDFRETTLEEQEQIINDYANPHVKFLAEKVESREEYSQARAMGYSFFQGYFFCEPLIISGQAIPTQKLINLELLQEVNSPEPNYERISNLIKRDVSTSYKLLKLINSAFFGFRTKITSIKHALVILGLNEIKKWISLVVFRNVGMGGNEELIRNSVIRARLGEVLAPHLDLGERSAEIFLMGLFSLMDALLGFSLEEALADLPLADDIMKALLGEDGRLKDIVELTKAYEKGAWEKVANLTGRLGIAQETIIASYLETIAWVGEFFDLTA